ncbi:MAG: substrate-binding domain-containing protein [Opitutae bacterium]|nr:substrate-binding domain-containing protein [Opitutae bacterium]
MKVAFALEMEWGLKHHSEIYAGCQKFANEAKWATSIIPNSPKVLETGSYDGIIARVGTSFHKMAQYKKIPLVNVWQNSPVKDVASVFSNNYETGAIAAEHLLGRGLRRFGFLGHNRDKADIQQLDGYTETLKSEGYQSTIFKFNRSVIEGNAEGWEEFILQLRKWIKGLQPPVGIHATSDINCRYLIEICKSLELKIPHDLAIVGSGNEPLICSSPYPSVTSIDKNFEEVGYQAAMLLDEMMKSGKRSKEAKYCQPQGIVPRQSTDSYASDHPKVALALRYIAESANRRIKVNDVVNAVATNRRTLERNFREFTGRTISHEISRMRIERAKRLMTESDHSFKELAAELGYRNSDHFYKSFLRAEGQTPSSFRKERIQTNKLQR